MEPPRGIEPRTYALREQSDVSATRAVIDLTRPNALGVSQTLLGCSGGFADSMRTQLSDSSRIRFPVVGFSRSACLRRSQSGSVRFSTTLLMTRVEVSRCTPGRTKLASMRGRVPLRQEGACGRWLRSRPRRRAGNWVLDRL
jgi:hypothetical protein